MYFITNNDGLIIAASSDFMSKVGSRDVCSIAPMLNSKIITLEDEDKLLINSKNLEYKYSKTEIYSSIGKLELYRLLDSTRQTKEAEDDESIAYLKKIKEGSIKKEDNEYEIPDIPVLHEDKDKNDNAEKQIDKRDNELEEFKAKREKEIKEIESVYKESIAKINPEDKIIEIKTKEPQETSNKDIVSLIEDIEVKKENTAQPLLDKNIKNKKEELEKEINKLVEETKIEDIKIPAIPEDTINNNKDSIVDELKDIKDEVAERKEKAKKKLEEAAQSLKDKIKKPKDAIVDEIKDIKDEIVEKKEEIKDKLEDTAQSLTDKIKIPAIPKEAIEESYKTVKIETKDDNNQEKNEFVAKEYISEEKKKIENKVENLADKADKVKDDIKEEVSQTIEKIEHNIEDKKKKLFSSDLFHFGKKKEERKETKKEENTTPVIDDLEDIILLDTKDEIKDIKDKVAEKKDEIKLKVDTEENIIDKIEHIENEVKENIATLEPELEDNKKENLALKKTIETIKEEEPDVTNKLSNETQHIATNEIIEKIINTQVDSIDLKKNAEKLNIDLNSYKMLLNSYLGEIDKYIPQLKEKNTQVINMLIDAGELLSLNTITSKLTSLKDSDTADKLSKIKEIGIFTKLLKKKSQNSTISEIKAETKEKPKIEDIEDRTKQVAKEELLHTKNIEIQESVKSEEDNLPETKMVKIEDSYTNNEPESTDPIIEITTAEELLDIITPIDVDLDPKIASEELNLPEELIVEFIHDFLKQAKEHLPIMVTSYLNKDIEKIQSTAHMLKGAANNLRLNKIADNLYKIQKENDLKDDKYLIKKFVAQIKGLEIELKNLGE